MSENNFIPPIEPATKEQVWQMRKLFDLYYDWVYTTDDSEQRGELKEDFAREAIKLVDGWSR